MPIDFFGFASRRKSDTKKRAKDEALVKVLVPVEKLALGMYVTELDRPWVETPFLFQGFELQTEEELRTIQNLCRYVYVDVTKRKDLSKEIINQIYADVPKDNSKNKSNVFVNPYGKMECGIPPEKISSFEQEIEHANVAYDNAEEVVTNFMQTVENGGGIDSTIAQKAIAQCVHSVLHSPDAMLWLSQLKNKDEYTAQHSLNVSILSIILGRYINLSATDLNIVGLCGMMHDVGKLLIPKEILDKAGALNEEENRTLKSHTRLGYNLLKSTNMSPAVAITALTHHEQLDGRGYPRRLLEDNITYFTKIVAITNAYDAMTRDSPQQKGKTHLEATHILTNLAGTHFDATLVAKFIECIGVYPPGSLVEMTNGCVAMVLEIHDKAKLRPKVALILDEKKQPVTGQILDLIAMPVDSQGNVYTIRNIIRAKDWNIDTSRYYRNILLKKGLKLSNPNKKT